MTPCPYTCGFVPEASLPNGANTGACYRANGACTVISTDANHPTPGRSCLEQGGIFVPNQACQSTPPGNLNFGLDNGYYVSQIDKDGDSLCSSAGCPNGLDPDQLKNFNGLSAALMNVECSEVPCPGDGNEDKEVNGKDILDWRVFAFQSNPMSPGYSSSWYDFNHDGQTDSSDLATIVSNLGKTCTKPR
jgi:hypothetical protein